MSGQPLFVPEVAASSYVTSGGPLIRAIPRRAASRPASLTEAAMGMFHYEAAPSAFRR